MEKRSVPWCQVALLAAIWLGAYPYVELLSVQTMHFNWPPETRLRVLLGLGIEMNAKVQI